MSLLIIQFVAMLLHRFGTLSHILASTQLFCFRKNLDRLSEDELVAEHFVEIAKELQAIRGIDEDSNDGASVADEAEMTISRRRVVKSLEHSRRSMMKKRTETLDAAFKKRFFALSSERSVVGGERDLTGDMVTPIVGGRSGRRRLTMRRGTIRALEQRRNSVFGTLDHSAENPYSDEAANGAPRGPSRRRIDRLFHHKNGEPRADGDGLHSDSDNEDVKTSTPQPKSGNGGSSKLNYQDSWVESDAAAVKRSGAMVTSGAPRNGRLPSVEQQLIGGKQGGEESSHF